MEADMHDLSDEGRSPNIAGPARGWEREMRRAREVQERLLPERGPRFASLECAGITIPAAGVGGDSYDFLRPTPRRLAIVVTDVSGKGVPAALMAASLQASLRSHFAIGAADLGTRLESVNRLFHGCTAPGHFATLFIGEYDDRTRRVRYANCGHVPPLLLRCDGSHEWLEPTAGVLGIRADWQTSTAATALAPGDTLVVCTDGVTEAMNPAREEFGLERLAAVARAARRLVPRALLQTVVDEVRRFGDGRLADDLTLVVARPRIPAGACAGSGLARGNGTGEGKRAGGDADLRSSW
jgi:serine phosphatase RsbU (regulator of sigma subunit)